MLQKSLKTSDIIKQWQIAKDKLEFYRKEELELRQTIINLKSSLLHDPFAEGVENVNLPPNMILKIGHGVAYSLLGEEKEIRNTQHRIGKMIGPVLGGRLINWKPVLVLSEYRKLPAKGAVLIERHIERRAKTKSLDLVS